MDPVDADAAGKDDDQTEAEEGNEGEALRKRQLGLVEGRQRKHPDEEVEAGARGGMGHQHRVFGETVLLGPRQVPVARDRPVTADAVGQGLTTPDIYASCPMCGGLETYLHSAKREMRMEPVMIAVAPMPTTFDNQPRLAPNQTDGT